MALIGRPGVPTGKLILSYFFFRVPRAALRADFLVPDRFAGLAFGFAERCLRGSRTRSFSLRARVGFTISSFLLLMSYGVMSSPLLSSFTLSASAGL